MTFQEQRAIEILKSLVEISNSGFKTLALLNGGGVIAVLTHLGRSNPPREIATVYVVLSIGAFVFGLVFCAFAYFTSHGTQLALYNEAIQNLINPVQNLIEHHRTWLVWARALCILSILMFLAGSAVAVLGLIGGVYCSVGPVK